ncbi:MAG: hypothetical protein HY790_08695 [Deltaproteobacteria bacterium]|nr:hypothetical protein [Deltaproteobacteria bacterium]MBI4795897.1 hypothetical protein [Deltaproteobacteria bacterium]
MLSLREVARQNPLIQQGTIKVEDLPPGVDIYGHWIPGEGRELLDKTLRGPKARPGQPLSVITGD